MDVVMNEKERRPWGWVQVLDRGEDYCVKKIYLCIWSDNQGKCTHVDLAKNIERFKSIYNLDISHKIMEYGMFMCGIKMDNEAIRDHFRLT